MKNKKILFFLAFGITFLMQTKFIKQLLCPHKKLKVGYYDCYPVKYICCKCKKEFIVSDIKTSKLKNREIAEITNEPN